MVVTRSALFVLFFNINSIISIIVIVNEKRPMLMFNFTYSDTTITNKDHG